MELNLDHSTTSVLEKLRHDLTGALPEMVSYARKFAINRNLKREAIMMSAQYQTLVEKEEIASFVETAADLVLKIKQDYLDNRESQHYAKQQEQKTKVINHYKKIKAPNGLVFQCKNLNKSFPSSNFSLKDINFESKLGDITGVVGENGNGKTTFFRIVAGELLKDSGDISYPLFDSVERQELDWKKIKSQIAFVPQELSKWYGTLKDSLHYEAALRGITGHANLEETEYISYRLGLADQINKTWSELSGGYKLRFALARALVWSPKLLILDEPLANLDVKSQAIVLTDLKALAKSLKNPVSIILSSQHLHEVESIADKILLLNNGNQVFYGNRSAIGLDRNRNYFELECDRSQEQLQKIFADLGLQVEIRKDRNQLVIKTALDLESKTILQTLLKSKVKVIYFRDISQSIKSAFI